MSDRKPSARTTFGGRRRYLLLVSLLAACNTMTDPQAVGSGRYLQFLRGGVVIAEMDTSNVGMMNCPNQAYLSIQQTPSLAGNTKCSDIMSIDPLPFSFRAHIQLTESDGYKRSSPYLTRTLTSQLCDSIRQATSAAEKTVILEDNCSSATSRLAAERKAALPVKPQPATPVASTPTASTPAERLRQLEQLRRERLVTEDEYNVRRRAILEQL